MQRFNANNEVADIKLNIHSSLCSFTLHNEAILLAAKQEHKMMLLPTCIIVCIVFLGYKTTT